jgi:hypothetical protein
MDLGRTHLPHTSPVVNLIRCSAQRELALHEQRGKRLIKEAEARRNAEITELKHKHQVSRKRRKSAILRTTR